MLRISLKNDKAVLLTRLNVVKKKKTYSVKITYVGIMLFYMHTCIILVIIRKQDVKVK